MAKENRGLKPSKKVIRWNRSFVVLAALLVLVLGIVGTTLAWLTDKTKDLTNTFEYAKVSCEVLETVTQTTKSDVRIKNTGNTDAYIRATYVVTIRDYNGNILYDAYETETFQKYMKDLEGKISTDPYWQKGEDGYLYYRLPVPPDGETHNLFGLGEIIDYAKIKINERTYAKTYVEILASAVQAMPTNAVEEAWGATVQSVTEGDSTINLLTAPGVRPEIPGN